MSKRRTILTISIATITFACAVLFRESVNPWISTTAAALFSLLLATPHAKREVRALFEVKGSAVFVAAALGALLAGLTHGAYRLADTYAPVLTAGVPDLYAAIEANPGPRLAIPLVVIIVFAEEVIWRGLVIHKLKEKLASVWVFFAAVALYVVPQIASGSWELVLAATVLGGIFGWQRMASGRLADPLVTHLVWTITVFCVFPLY